MSRLRRGVGVPLAIGAAAGAGGAVKMWISCQPTMAKMATMPQIERREGRAELSGRRRGGCLVSLRRIGLCHEVLADRGRPYNLREAS